MRMINVAGAMLAVILISALLAGCSGESTPSPSVKQQENPVATVPAANQPLNEETPTPTPTPQVIQTLKLVNPVFDKPSGNLTYTIQAFDVHGAEVTGRMIPVTGVYYVTGQVNGAEQELTRGNLPANISLGVANTIPAGFTLINVKSPMFMVNINWGAYQDFNTLKPLAYSQASLNQVAGFRLNAPFWNDKNGGIGFIVDALNLEGNVIIDRPINPELEIYVTGKVVTTSEVKELDRKNLSGRGIDKEIFYSPIFAFDGKLKNIDPNSLIIHAIIKTEEVRTEDSKPLTIPAKYFQ